MQVVTCNSMIALFQDVDKWIEFVSSIKFKSRRTSRMKATQPFKEGWLMTLKAVSILLSNLLARDGIAFVLTRRLNQDPIEVSYITTTTKSCGQDF